MQNVQEAAANQALLQQGIELMIYGMGTVFVFLAILVVVTTTMSTLVNRFFPEQVVAAKPQAPVKPQAAAAQATDDATLMAVISAAVHQYRSRQK